MTPCPICQSSNTVHYFKGVPSLTLCHSCGLKFQDPMPDEAGLTALYNNSYFNELYPEHQLLEQKRLFAHRLAWLEPMAGNGKLRILEVGSGRGVFLDAAIERGHSVTPQDLSTDAVNAIIGRLGVSAMAGTLEELELPGESFDLVHINHVLEHIPDPAVTLREIHRLLRPGGVLYVEVPRQSNLLNRLSGLMAGSEFGFTYHPGHLYLFSPESLRRLMTDCGLPPLVTRIEGMSAPHRFVRGVHYQSLLAHLVKLVAGGLRIERWLGGGNLASVAIKAAEGNHL